MVSITFLNFFHAWEKLKCKSLLMGCGGNIVMSPIRIYPKMDDKGRVTIPKYVRVGMDLHPGDILEITLDKYLDSRK